MTVQVYYFAGTGNCMAVARAVADRMGGRGRTNGAKYHHPEIKGKDLCSPAAGEGRQSR